MSASADLKRLITLGVPVVTTSQAAAVFRASVGAANKTLSRLALAGLVLRIRHGLWATRPALDPKVLPEYLTQPWPSYISLQTALYAHGMIEQIPSVIFAVSLDRARRIRTSVGTFLIHHVAPEFFGGFEEKGGVKMATPEKALLDMLYLSGTRARMLSGLPELELPPRFRMHVVKQWLARVPNARTRTHMKRKLELVAAQFRNS